MSYTNVWKTIGSILVIAAPLFAGCAVAPADAESGDDEANVGESEQAISCTDASCTGLNPFNTSCILDQQVKGSGTISDQFGSALGTVTLYYSPTCHAIWGYAGFNTSHGTFQVCATDITNVSQPPQCLSYGSTTFGAPSKMQFLRVNDSGYANVFVNSPTLGSGSTPSFKRTF
ncbi:MAG: DUF2690 domain-containing protein [Minicystis sp.]